MAKVVRARKRVAAQSSKPVGTGIGVQKVVYGRVDFMLGQGGEYEDIDHTEVQEFIRKTVLEKWPHANFTPAGGHYLIDGKEKGSREVCRFEDFDRETMDRKPGTFPPSYTLAPGFARKQAEEAERLLAERNAKQKSEPNELGKQPEKLLTSREMDDLKNGKTAPAAKKVVKKIAPPAKLKRTVRVRRAGQ